MCDDDDRTNGEELRDRGMERVAENAGEWKYTAQAEIDGWFSETPEGEVFTGEDIRTAIQSVVGEPHHHNAWSAVIGGRIRKWLAANLIEIEGTSLAKVEAAHARLMRQYRRTGTPLKTERRAAKAEAPQAWPVHRCHARGCEAVDCHPELPFCKRHFNLLPGSYRGRLWRGRRQDGVCGACEPRDADEVPLRAADGWYELLNQSEAILLILEYEDCGGHPQLLDREGFCWGCGIFNAEKTYQEARAVIKKFNLEKGLYA